MDSLEKISKKAEKVTVSTTDKFLSKSIGWGCFFWLHQPKVPAAVLEKYKK